MCVRASQKVEAVRGTDDKVLKKTLVEGEGYDKPNEGATVTVKLTGRVLGGARASPPPEQPTVS